MNSSTPLSSCYEKRGRAATWGICNFVICNFVISNSRQADENFEALKFLCVLCGEKLLLRAVTFAVGHGNPHLRRIVHGALAAAWAGWNRCPVWAGARMSQKRADSFGRFGREDVLELARLLLDFLFIHHSETFGEQALRQAMPPDHVGSPLPPPRRELHNQLAVAGIRG